METVGDLFNRWDLLTDRCLKSLQTNILWCLCEDSHEDYVGSVLKMTFEQIEHISRNCGAPAWRSFLFVQTAAAVRMMLKVESIPESSIEEALTFDEALSADFSALETNHQKGFTALASERAFSALRERISEVEKFHKERYPLPPGSTLGFSYLECLEDALTNNPKSLSTALLHEVIYSSPGHHIIRGPSYLSSLDTGPSDTVMLFSREVWLPSDNEKVMSTASALCEQLSFLDAITAARALEN